MTRHVHRRPHQYGPVAWTLASAAVIGSVAVGVLTVYADDAEAAPKMRPVLVCFAAGDEPSRCSERAPLPPSVTATQAADDWADYQAAAVARFGRLVGQALRLDAVPLAS